MGVLWLYSLRLVNGLVSTALPSTKESINGTVMSVLALVGAVVPS